MKNDFAHIIFKEEILQSNAFGSQYREYFGENNGPTFNNPLSEDINSIYNAISLKYTGLSNFQKDVLNKLFNTFNEIIKRIYPNRLKSFEYFLNDDDELLLYRNTKTGLVNLIVNPEECVAYSYIGKGDDVRILKFYEIDGDFESLAYHFFSK